MVKKLHKVGPIGFTIREQPSTSIVIATYAMKSSLAKHMGTLGTHTKGPSINYVVSRGEGGSKIANLPSKKMTKRRGGG